MREMKRFAPFYEERVALFHQLKIIKCWSVFGIHGIGNVLAFLVHLPDLMLHMPRGCDLCSLLWIHISIISG